MANLPKHLEPQWELFRNEPLKAQLRREVIRHRLEEIDQGRGGLSEHWWYDQRYVDKVVPAEYVNPDELDTFNYRYQVYARHPPIQCEPRSLAEVTDERPPLRYNIKRISQGKPLEVSLPSRDSQWGAKSYVLECPSQNNNENHCRSKNNNSCIDRQTERSYNDNAAETDVAEKDKMPSPVKEKEGTPRSLNAYQDNQNWNEGAEDPSRQRQNRFPVMPSHNFTSCAHKNARPLLDANVNRLTSCRNIGASPSCSSRCTSRSSSPCRENINRSNRCLSVSKADLRKGAMLNCGNMAVRRGGNGTGSSRNSSSEEHRSLNNNEIMSPWSAPSERSQSPLSCASNEERRPLSQNASQNDVIERSLETESRLNLNLSDKGCLRKGHSEKCAADGKSEDDMSSMTGPEGNREIAVKTQTTEAIGDTNIKHEDYASPREALAVSRTSSLAVSGGKDQSRTSINLNNNKGSNFSSETTMCEAKVGENKNILTKIKRPLKRSGVYTSKGRADSVAGLLVAEECFDIGKKMNTLKIIHDKPEPCLEIPGKRFGRRFGYNVAALNNNIAGLLETKLGGLCTRKHDVDWSKSLLTSDTNCTAPQNMPLGRDTPQTKECLLNGDRCDSDLVFQTNECIAINENRSGKRMGYHVAAQKDTMGSLITGSYKETIRSGRRSCQDGGYASMADSNNLKSLLCYQMSDNSNNNNIHLPERDIKSQCSRRVNSSGEYCNESREDLAFVLNIRSLAYCPENSFVYAENTPVDDLILEGEDRDTLIPKIKLARVGGFFNRLERMSKEVKFLHGDVCLCTNNNSKYNNNILEVDCKPLRLCRPQGNGSEFQPFKCRAKPWAKPVSKVICSGIPADGEPYNSKKHHLQECTVLPMSGPPNEDLVLICKPKRSKTPEIGYGTYKIVGGLSRRHPPPADLLANLKLPPHLAEYTEFIRRCPNFTIGRYDKSDPAYEMLLPANRTSQALTMQLKPFVYARNPRAGKYPPLFHDPVSTKDLQWSLPSFANIR